MAVLCIQGHASSKYQISLEAPERAMEGEIWQCTVCCRYESTREEMCMGSLLIEDLAVSRSVVLRQMNEGEPLFLWKCFMRKLC